MAEKFIHAVYDDDIISDSEITIGFVFHSRKYSDGSSNLRIQFTKGRGQQYAKNSVREIVIAIKQKLIYFIIWNE